MPASPPPVARIKPSAGPYTARRRRPENDLYDDGWDAEGGARRSMALSWAVPLGCAGLSMGPVSAATGHPLVTSVALAWAAAAWAVEWGAADRHRERVLSAQARGSKPPGPVSIIVPVLNEAAGVEAALQRISNLDPPPRDVVVVDGGSIDGTRERVRRWTDLHRNESFKVTLVGTARRGRGRQMNAGVPHADGDVLIFLHCDSSLPQDAVAVMSQALSDPLVCAAGFTSVMDDGEDTFWGMTAHNALKTFYMPALLRPVDYFRGLRCLLGDQCVFVRRKDFNAVGGYQEELPLMEDADLVVRLFERGAERPGRPAQVVRQLGRCATTSGRRVKQWGGWRSTFTHFGLGLAWHFGASPQTLDALVDVLYRDVR